jgi:hypothetical protein
VTRDRYLNVDDPRDPPAEAQAPPGGAAGTAAPLDRDPPQEGPAESEADRCLRAVREVLLGQPVPHSLEEAAAEIERRLKGGAR